MVSPNALSSRAWWGIERPEPLALSVRGGVMVDPKEFLKAVLQLHGHKCSEMILGLRAGAAAMNWLGVAPGGTQMDGDPLLVGLQQQVHSRRHPLLGREPLHANDFAVDHHGEDEGVGA
jgi:hypothetical protein